GATIAHRRAHDSVVSCAYPCVCIRAQARHPPRSHRMSEDCWSDPEACPIPDAWTRTFHARSGREYRIQVRVPADVAPAGGFPTLYVLDGDDLFGIAAEAARMLANWRPASR